MINKNGVAWVCYDGEVTDSWPIAENWDRFEHEFKELTADQYKTYISAIREIGLAAFKGGAVNVKA